MHKNKGFTRIAKAGIYASNGILAALRGEAAFRQECLLALIFVPVAFYLPLETVERVVLVCVTMLVLIVELINSAIEAVVDRVGMELHELSGRAKDMGSGAVLVSLVVWVYAWIEIALLG